MENNNQNWIDLINKKLEEQRNNYRESIESGETFKRHQAYASKCADGKGGKVTTERYGGAKFLLDWREENPEDFQESASLGGINGSAINKENGTGMYGWTDEERSIYGTNNAKSFWENATEEELKNRADKCSDSMKELINEKGWWNPHQYITPELQKEMAEKMVATRLNQREQRIKDLYDAINTNDWFTLEYATDILSSISKSGASESTTRRMIHGWSEASKYYEYRKTELSDEGRPYMQWRKK